MFFVECEGVLILSFRWFVRSYRMWGRGFVVELVIVGLVCGKRSVEVMD